MNLLCMSDIHGDYEKFAPDKLPDADLCVIAGDITNRGLRDTPEFMRSQAWMEDLSVRFPILWVPGNHDLLMCNDTYTSPDGYGFINGIEGQFCGYLDATFQGVSMSPSYDMPELASRWTNMTTRWDVEEAAYARLLPFVNVVVSHCPPFGILDAAGLVRNPDGSWQKRSIGSGALLDFIGEHKPKLVICGHVHGADGQATVVHANGKQTRIVNVAQTWRVVEVGE